MGRDRRALALQVRDGVRKLIADDHLQAGDQIPTEEELSARFEVSRTTLREALRLLEQDGVLDVRHGNGRFLSALPMIERPITRLEGMTELLLEMGYHVSDRVIAFEVRDPLPEEQEALHLPTGAQVIHLERVRTQDKEPLTYSSVAMPRSLFPASLAGFDWAMPLHDVLQTLGHRTTASNAQIRAVMLPRSVARATGLPATMPFILLVQTLVSQDGTFLLYAHDYFRSDHFKFDVRRRRD